jgi:uncharacterized membrane protein (UPF0127 family)
MPNPLRIDLFRRQLLLPCFVLLCAAPLLQAQAPVPLDSFPRSTLEIRSSGGRHWLKVWIASTPAQQMQGLMFVRQLSDDEGMLFPLAQPRVMTMWMKNTLIPLDMLFIDSKGRVACVRERTEPESLDLISCDTPVKAVLEIAGGQARTRGIGVGDTVVHALLHE